MLAVIPESETDLKTRLKSIRDSVPFTAPEMMATRWQQGQAVIAMYFNKLPNQLIDWERKVISAWMGTEV